MPDPSPRYDPIDRRRFLARGAIVGGAVVSSPWWLQAPSIAGNTCRWGSTAQPTTGQTQQQALAALEDLVQRRFSLSHHRTPWTVPLVNGFSRWAVNGGRTPILSWFARNKNKSLVGFRRIASGDYDAWITEQARNLRAAGWSGYLCFHKEPEDETSPADWTAAYARVRQIFRNVGVTNFKWVVCLIATTFSKPDIAQWMPSAEWDLLGADANNRYRCTGRPWKSFGDLFGPARTFAQAQSRNLLIVEYGSVEGETGRKAAWIDDARATVKSWPEIKAVSYLHENSDCNYRVNTSKSALQAFRAMGQDPYFA